MNVEYAYLRWCGADMYILFQGLILIQAMITIHEYTVKNKVAMSSILTRCASYVALLNAEPCVPYMICYILLYIDTDDD